MNTLRAVLDHVPAEIAELTAEIEMVEQRLLTARARKARLIELLAVAERPLSIPDPRSGIRLIVDDRPEPEHAGPDFGRRTRG